jgi:excisionase family DNA binding protein
LFFEHLWQAFLPSQRNAMKDMLPSGKSKNQPGVSNTDPFLIDKKTVAKLLGCSTRHVDRMADDGRMPPPVHIGHLVRWRRTEIESWIANGCPATPRPHQG